MTTTTVHMNYRKLLSFVVALAFVVSLAPAAFAEGEDLANGEAVFNTCTPCHGAAGEGTDLASAPAIAGLPQWYVEVQLDKFQNGARGKHPDDVEGLRMRPMARSLMDSKRFSAARVKDVAAYVASLPVVETPHTVEGNAENGKALYTPCIACHGQAGQGSQPLGGPPLVGQSDWYLESSIHKFQSGVRGGDPSKDQSGAIMAAMSNTLTDDKIKDVIAYIRTLGE
ncbi:MAG: c-type cytochrome [Myxococcota bacterium]|nr:c-type cytochrome [Myxococcota bacterium]